MGVDPEKQQDYLDKILKKGLSVSQTEKMVRADKEQEQPKKKVMLKGITRNMKIALNTIRQALKMVEKAGIELETKEEESEDYVTVTIRFQK